MVRSTTATLGEARQPVRGEVLLRTERLSKTYATRAGEAVHALQDVSLAVGDGEFVSLVGPSGCGKTTLLMILAGLVPRSSGEVRFKDADVHEPCTEIGLVFQRPVLLPWRTVLDNTLLPAEVLGLGRERLRPRALDLLKMVGLSGFEGKYPSELSGGMQQRNAITRALLQDPAVLLMDEPFGALDAMTRDRMSLELQRIWEMSRKTVVFVTHSIQEAVFLSDRVVVMTARPGQIAEVLRVELPRPRTLEIAASPKYNSYVLHIRKLLEGEVHEG
ncbi:MAG: ABC transporter ATP-binding protein [Chloroflexi bacterium]|nr:ABC transporter ATP-binding protein [Chloroflexota bacterium]